MTDAKISTAAVEFAGRNWLTAQLLAHDFEVATPVVDRGIDLIAFREQKVGKEGIKALPLQLKCALAERFSLHTKYRGRGIPLVYVWHVLKEPEAFILDYAEALEVLGAEARASKSWCEGGHYAFTTISSALRERLLQFKLTDRWIWLATRLESQPTSG